MCRKAEMFRKRRFPEIKAVCLTGGLKSLSTSLSSWRRCCRYELWFQPPFTSSHPTLPTDTHKHHTAFLICCVLEDCVWQARVDHVSVRVCTWLQTCAEWLSHACDGRTVSSLGLGESGCDPAHLIPVMLRDAPELTAHTMTLKHMRGTTKYNMRFSTQNLFHSVWDSCASMQTDLSTHLVIKMFPMNQTHDLDITAPATSRANCALV